MLDGLWNLLEWPEVVFARQGFALFMLRLLSVILFISAVAFSAILLFVVVVGNDEESTRAGMGLLLVAPVAGTWGLGTFYAFRLTDMFDASEECEDQSFSELCSVVAPSMPRILTHFLSLTWLAMGLFWFVLSGLGEWLFITDTSMIGFEKWCSRWVIAPILRCGYTSVGSAFIQAGVGIRGLQCSTLRAMNRFLFVFVIVYGFVAVPILSAIIPR